MSRLDKYERNPGGAESPRDVRGVPLTTRLATMFGGFMTQFGAAFFTFGMIFWWIFGAQADVTSWYKFGGELNTASGTVTACEDTGVSEGGGEHSEGTPIYRIDYRFELDKGVAYESECYATGYNPDPGQQVEVEYVADDPVTSRIEGTRKGIIGPWGLFVAIFPLVGFIFMVKGFRQGAKSSRMLSVGKLARGRLVDKTATGAKINNQRVYRYTFEFEDENGDTHRITDKTHHTSAVEDEELERLLYNPKKPDEGKLVDTLPGGPHVNEDGTITPVGTRHMLARMLLPVGGAIGHGAVGVILYLL